MTKTFQTILLAVFGFFILVGLVVLAVSKGGGSASSATVVVWGTENLTTFQSIIGDVLNNRKDLKVEYVEKSPATFDQDLVEAMASGKGPDAFFLSQDMILRQKDRIFPIPYASLSARTFKDTFIQEAELYMDNSGILAMPISIDPLVMYWNRDLFSNAGLPNYPKTWSEFLTLPLKLTVKDKTNKISQSAVALGEFGNINNAKEITSALILQTGNPIVEISSTGVKSSVLSNGNEPASAVNFYTEFANPLKADYSWNRSLPTSKNFFLSGNLAVYFGFASEFSDIKLKNPNLNFDIAPFPQILGTQAKATFGRMQAIAISKNTKNFDATFNAMVLLSGTEMAGKLAEKMGLPPVRRDLLAIIPSDTNSVIFYNSALISKGWLDPRREDTSVIFKNMIESITGGRDMVSGAVGTASRAINDLLQQ